MKYKLNDDGTINQIDPIKFDQTDTKHYLETTAWDNTLYKPKWDTTNKKWIESETQDTIQTDHTNAQAIVPDNSAEMINFLALQIASLQDQQKEVTAQ